MFVHSANYPPFIKAFTMYIGKQNVFKGDFGNGKYHNEKY